MVNVIMTTMLSIRIRSRIRLEQESVRLQKFSCDGSPDYATSLPNIVNRCTMGRTVQSRNIKAQIRKTLLHLRYHAASFQRVSYQHEPPLAQFVINENEMWDQVAPTKVYNRSYSKSLWLILYKGRGGQGCYYR